MNEVPIIAARIFEREEVVVSGKKFVDCVFKHCVLVFDGRPINMDGCDTSFCDWNFVGAAAMTIDLLRANWAAGGRILTAKTVSIITGASPQDVLVSLTGSTDLPDQAPR